MSYGMVLGYFRDQSPPIETRDEGTSADIIPEIRGVIFFSSNTISLSLGLVATGLRNHKKIEE